LLVNPVQLTETSGNNKNQDLPLINLAKSVSILLTKVFMFIVYTLALMDAVEIASFLAMTRGGNG